MEHLALPQAKLLYFASQLPAFEKAILKELILEGNEDVLTAVEAYKGKQDAEEFRSAILTAVITRAVDKANEWWDEIFENCSTNDAKKLAKAAKQRLGEHTKLKASLVYGEVDFASFATLLEKAKPQPGQTFVDIGHGSGRALVAAVLLHGHTFSKIQGVELLEDLFVASKEMLQKYKQLEQREKTYFGNQDRAEVSVFQGDITDLTTFDWTTADVVFANSTCFDNNLMDSLAKIGEKMKSGAKFITLTKKLNSDAFTISERKQYAMSWGPATCFIQERKEDGTNS
mmetsp:Transcript_15496/g.20450  ORF Transcript_15496/g.20450 Transcript_15496/m.20450 type:complete len:286 (+) Transcript_15496:75-932(+)